MEIVFRLVRRTITEYMMSTRSHSCYINAFMISPVRFIGTDMCLVLMLRHKIHTKKNPPYTYEPQLIKIEFSTPETSFQSLLL